MLYPCLSGQRRTPSESARMFGTPVMKVLIANGNPELGRDVAAALDLAPVDVRIRRFADQEQHVEIRENVRGEDVYVIQPSSAPVAETLMELLIIADTLKRGSARRIT